MSITIDEVRRIAALARLAVTDEEAARYAADLSRVLDYADSIRAIDTKDVPPTTHVLDLVDVWRPDEPGESLDRDIVLAEAPQSEDGCFVAPRIV